jgi:hypothetical protein
MVIESADRIFSLKMEIYDSSLKTYTWTPKMGSSGGQLNVLNSTGVSSNIGYFQVLKLKMTIDYFQHGSLEYPYISSVAPDVQASQCSASAITAILTTTQSTFSTISTVRTTKTRTTTVKPTVTTTTCITVTGMSPVYGNLPNSSKYFTLPTSELNQIIFFSGAIVYGFRAIFINSTFQRYGVIANTTGLIKLVSFIFIENIIVQAVNVTQSSTGSLTSLQFQIFNTADNTTTWSSKIGDTSGLSPVSILLNEAILAWKTPLFQLTELTGAFDLNGGNGTSSFLSNIQFSYSALKCN